MDSIQKVLGKCQLQEAVQEKEGGLDSSGTLSCLAAISLLLPLCSDQFLSSY